MNARLMEATRKAGLARVRRLAEKASNNEQAKEEIATAIQVATILRDGKIKGERLA